MNALATTDAPRRKHMIRLEDPDEMTLYRNYYRAAERGDMVPGYARLYEMLDISEGSGALINADARLIDAGLIRVESYQRSRRVFVVELGKWTAEPRNTAPHWRKRPEHAGRTKSGRVIQSQRAGE